jgi:hypothetical protein
MKDIGASPDGEDPQPGSTGTDDAKPMTPLAQAVEEFERELRAMGIKVTVTPPSDGKLIATFVPRRRKT